ncbi:MAG: uroporphyrinogen decarboxylase family protein [Nitrososphaerales archaeon]
MNSWERVTQAMELKEPDTLPVFYLGMPGNLTEAIIGRIPFYRNPPIYLEACSKGKAKEAAIQVAQDQIDLAEKLDSDIIRETNQLGGWFLDPRWEYIPSNISVRKLSEKEWEIDGKRILYSPAINSLFNPNSYLPIDEDKARDFMRTHWKDDEIPEEEILPTKIIARACKGKRFIIACVQGTLLPFYSAFDKMMLWIRSNPSLFKMWSEFYLRRNIKRALLKIEAGADAIFENDDYAFKTGTFLSIQQFREFVWPNLKKLCDGVKKKGAFFIKHTDGNINSIIGEIVDLGIDGFHSLEKDASVDIGKIKELYGDKICLLGNLDQARTFTQGSEDVVKEIIECINKASYGGGHILTTSNNFTPDVKVENIITMFKAARKYGKYPLIKS